MTEAFFAVVHVIGILLFLFHTVCFYLAHKRKDIVNMIDDGVWMIILTIIMHH